MERSSQCLNSAENLPADVKRELKKFFTRNQNN